MSAFEQQLQSDMDAVFCNIEEFGELITYRPLNKPVMPLTAVVTRHPPLIAGATARFQVNQMQVDIPKGSIASRPVLDGDAIQLCDSAKWWTVVKLLDESDPGAWHMVVN